jgi:RsiW-degrading membrane proteinase PrsW (M82 family)
MKSFRYHWKENIKPLIIFFLAGALVAAGFATAEWLIPKKPVEYRICVQDAGGDYMCEVYK